CRAGLSSCCWADWPCTATRSSARYVSSDTGTERPPANARERPSPDTVLVRTRGPSSSRSPPASQQGRLYRRGRPRGGRSPVPAASPLRLTVPAAADTLAADDLIRRVPP